MSAEPFRIDPQELGEFRHRDWTGKGFRAFVQEMHEVAALLWSQAPPEDDAPGLFAFAYEDMLSLWIPPGEAWNSSDSKHMMVHGVVCRLAKQMRARNVAVLSAAWEIKGDSPSGRKLERMREAGEQTPPFGSFPARDSREVVLLTLMDPEVWEYHHAPVIRVKSRRPRLGAWDVISSGDRDQQMEGLIIGPIQEAIR